MKIQAPLLPIRSGCSPRATFIRTLEPHRKALFVMTLTQITDICLFLLTWFHLPFPSSTTPHVRDWPCWQLRCLWYLIIIGFTGEDSWYIHLIWMANSCLAEKGHSWTHRGREICESFSQVALWRMISLSQGWSKRWVINGYCDLRFQEQDGTKHCTGSCTQDTRVSCTSHICWGQAGDPRECLGHLQTHPSFFGFLQFQMGFQPRYVVIWTMGNKS